MNKLLVVEDDEITAEMLRRYFEIIGYEVVNATTGADAINMAGEHKPDVVILDIILPDMDGYEIAKRLRSDKQTDRIPIIFLTQKDERRDRLSGLSLGVDDYITKPFDVDELRLRVHNIIDRIGGPSLVDARTGLPNRALIQERLPRLLKNPDSVYLDILVEHFEPFSAHYGPAASNQVIRSTAKIIADLLHEVDPINSFLGHPGDTHFLIAVPDKAIERVEKELPKRFQKQVNRFYDYMDLARGQMQDGDQLVSLMDLKLERIDAAQVQAHISGKKVEEKISAGPPAAAEAPTQQPAIGDKTGTTPTIRGAGDPEKPQT